MIDCQLSFVQELSFSNSHKNQLFHHLSSSETRSHTTVPQFNDPFLREGQH